MSNDLRIIAPSRQRTLWHYNNYSLVHYWTAMQKSVAIEKAFNFDFFYF